MNIEEESEPTIGLSFTRPMPLSWERCNADTGSHEAEQERMRNERLFQLLLVYDEHHNDRREEEGEHNSDLDRVEAKLDVVIQLLASIVGQRTSSHRERLISVAAQHLAWNEEELNAPTVGDRLWVLLEIDPRLPQPLKMICHVVQLILVESEGVRVCVKLEDPGERVQLALEKLIFRIHRREIARMRANKKS